MRAAAGGLLVLLAACGSGSDDVRHAYQNKGVLCVYPPGAIGADDEDPTVFSYSPGALLRVGVWMPACITSCDYEVDAQCTASVKGGALLVESSGRYTEHSPCDGTCTPLLATCPLPALAEGSHVVSHGIDQLTLTLPFVGKAPCVGMPLTRR